MTTQRLTKNSEKGIWSGVLYGLAEHFEVDPAIVRIGYCLFSLATGFFFGLVLYFILSFCIPDKADV
jgi:phage shock protein PspC (stress-responsive transcriptional regulator)